MHAFRGKRVFLTGGSSGIGLATAERLVSMGASVLIAGRRVEALRHTVSQLRSRGSDGRIDCLTLDISDRHAVQTCVPRVIEMLGGLDILINNAGIAHAGRVEEMSDEFFDELMHTNYFGTVHVTRAFLPHFMQQCSGYICNVSSLLGLFGAFGYAAYAASKFAVTGFSECLRQELLPHGVSVSVFCPGDTDTPQLRAEAAQKPQETRAITRRVRIVSASHAASVMLEGIARKKFYILPPGDTRRTWFLYRIFPGIVRAVMDYDLRRCVKNSRRKLATTE